MGQVISRTGTTECTEPIEDKNILLLGAGNFGTCLADHLASIEKPIPNNVTIYARDQAVVDGINNHNMNVKHLKDIPLTKTIKATTQLTAELFSSNSVIVFAIPSQAMRSILEKIKVFIQPQHLLVFVNKGIEKDTLSLPNDIVNQTLPKEIAQNAAFLSGPSFAQEVVKRRLTCVSVASLNIDRAKRTQHLFHTSYFRVYDTIDVVGIEASGALKNVIALASGACTGLGLESNARAALITRGLAEVCRIGVLLGANPLTFQGLGGVGDLLLTCTSEKSRNFTVGYRLGKGEKLQHVLDTLGSTAEGVETSIAAYNLVQKLNVDAPIVIGVYQVLYEGKSIKEVFEDIVGRESKSELEL